MDDRWRRYISSAENYSIRCANFARSLQPIHVSLITGAEIRITKISVFAVFASATPQVDHCQPSSIIFVTHGPGR